jgi:RNA polymerase sigma factor (sigma-70 family)
MSDWTRERLVRALHVRDAVELRALVRHLERPILVGIAFLSRSKPWLTAGADRTREDEVQAVLEYLFRDGARVLLKFGQSPEFVHTDGALAKFVTGVTIRHVQKMGRRRALAWQRLEDDMAALDHDAAPRRGQALLEQVLDLEKAAAALAPSDQELLDHLYVQQRSQDELCELLAISPPTFQQRKSRLLKRLAQFIQH